jgi:glycosyltransferase involved in cell wall biosynthesis
LEEAGLTRGIKGWLAKALLHYVRLWDVRSAFGVDHFITLSRYIARRIAKVYRRQATVIYPPVNVDRFGIAGAKEPFYFTASRMVPYKRMDLITEAFARMPGCQLKVVGDGPEMARVRGKAAPNIELLGFQRDDVVCRLMQVAQAFVFAAEEDFGIVSVEAQACGTPVIAYGRGGATETVISDTTGLFFHEQTPESLMAAVERFERCRATFDPQVIRKNAERFSEERFRLEFSSFVEEKWAEFEPEVGRFAH